MVMVQFSDKTTNIEGQVGGVYYRHDQCLNHIQAMPRVIRGRGKSPQQKAFGRCKNYWSSHHWSSVELDCWWIWSYNHPRKNKKGETVFFHPFTAFLSYNIKRILNGDEILPTPID